MKVKENNLTIKNYKKHIDINPDVQFGKPCIKGTRISVYDVLSWLSLEMKNDEIVAEYKNLTIKMIRVCLAYAADKGERLRSAS